VQDGGAHPGDRLPLDGAAGGEATLSALVEDDRLGGPLLLPAQLGQEEPAQRDRSGKPVVLLPGDTFHATSRRELDAVALEAFRRRCEP
jgi:hypothetical protein